MVKLFDMIDEGEFNNSVQNGLVTLRDHPVLPLTIAGYTPACQYSRNWNATTRACRGLIYDTNTLEVVGRPFEKFFNYGEAEAPEVPPGGAIRMPKADGSLGIVFNYEGKWHVATRGSFTSEQAIWANKWLDANYDIVSDFNPADTYMTEIIFPENRIVVDYEGWEGLILLDVIDKSTGLSDIAAFRDVTSMTKAPRVFIDEFDAMDVYSIPEGDEGFVYLWPEENVRLKLKSQWYQNAHAVVTNATPLSVWKMLSSGKSVRDICIELPDEFHSMIETFAEPLISSKRDIQELWTVEYNSIYLEGESRKDFAAKAVSSENPKAMFILRDGGSTDSLAWNYVRPRNDKWSTER